MLRVVSNSQAALTRLFGRREWIGSVLAVVFVMATGCGGEGPKNVVSGKVNLGSDPVSGVIQFKMSDGKEYSAPGVNGIYGVSIETVGDATIVVKADPNAPLAPKGSGPAPAMPKGPPMPGMPALTKSVAPPTKYATDAGGLKYTVKAGTQTHDIELTP